MFLVVQTTNLTIRATTRRKRLKESKGSNKDAFRVIETINSDLHEFSYPLQCKPDPKNSQQLLYLDPKFDNKCIKNLCAQFAMKEGREEYPEEKKKEVFIKYMREHWPFVLSFTKPDSQHTNCTRPDGFCYYNICMQLIYKWKQYFHLGSFLKPDELSHDYCQFPSDCEQAVKLLCEEIEWLDDPDDPRFPSNHPFIDDLKQLINTTIALLSNTNSLANINGQRPEFVSSTAGVWGTTTTAGYLFLHHEQVPFLFFNMLSSIDQSSAEENLYHPWTDRAQLIRWKDEYNNYHESFQRSSTVGRSYGHYVTMNDVTKIFTQHYNEFAIIFNNKHFFFLDVPDSCLAMLEKGFTIYCNSVYNYFKELMFMQDFKWKKDLLEYNVLTTNKQYPFGNGNYRKPKPMVHAADFENLRLAEDVENLKLVEEVVDEADKLKLSDDTKSNDENTNNDKEEKEAEEEQENRFSVLGNIAEQTFDQSFENGLYLLSEENLSFEDLQAIVVSRMEKSMVKFIHKYEEVKKKKK